MRPQLSSLQSDSERECVIVAPSEVSDTSWAFSAEQVAGLTGLSLNQLAYWRNTGFFGSKPEKGEPALYSFRELVGLRTVALLRRKIPLQELRRVGEWLAAHHQDPWSSLRFYLAGRTVVFGYPGSEQLVSTRPAGQTEMGEEYALERVAADVRQDARRLRERTPEQIGRVVQRRNVAGNAPVIEGTRIRTSAIWNFRQAGCTIADIQRQYPRLTEKDIKAALDYESRQPRRKKRSA
jgi:uncharacterized protein (DUF433 family)